MKKELLDKLNKMKKNTPFMFAPPALNEQINDAENYLGAKFSKEYRDFLAVYGGAMVGPYPIYGVNSIELMDDNLNTIQLVTMSFRRRKWINVEDGLVVSENHSGDPIVLRSDGTIFMGSHDGLDKLIWNNFNDFLSWCADR